MAADQFPAGVPFEIGAALFAALQAWPALSGAKVFDNPERVSTLLDGERLLFVEDVADRSEGQTPVAQKRTYTFNMGVINRSSDARRGAHSDYRAAKRCLLQVLKSMPRALQVTSVFRETDVTYRIENIDVGGALVLGTFTVDYRDPS